MNKVAFCIVTMNQLECLRMTISSIIKEGYTTDDIYIWDNHSRNKELKTYLQSFKHATLSTHNIGHPGGLNQVFNQAIDDGREIIIRCDHDIEFTQNSIKELLDVCRETKGIVGPASNAGNPIQTKPHNPDTYEPLYPEAYQYGTYIEINSIIGFCMVIPKEIYLDVG